MRRRCAMSETKLSGAKTRTPLSERSSSIRGSESSSAVTSSPGTSTRRAAGVPRSCTCRCGDRSGRTRTGTSSSARRSSWRCGSVTAGSRCIHEIASVSGAATSSASIFPSITRFLGRWPNRVAMTTGTCTNTIPTGRRWRKPVSCKSCSKRRWPTGTHVVTTPSTLPLWTTAVCYILIVPSLLFASDCTPIFPLLLLYLNPLECRGNYIATSNDMKLVHWPLMGGLLHLYSDEGTGRGRSPPRPLLAVPNVTAHPSTASVPITVLMYSGPLICSFNVTIKGWAYIVS